MSNQPRKFVFVVHALSRIHRQIIGLRGAKLGLMLGRRDGLDFRDVSPLARFHLTASSQELVGEVVAIPMTPEEMLEHQDIALDRMVRAIKMAELDGSRVVAVGLGSLCSIVAKRGKALQEKIAVPVTTGNAATAWTLIRNCMTANPKKERMGILGAGSPVGQIVAEYLTEQGIYLTVDNTKISKKLGIQLEKDAERLVKQHQLLVGCGPTGPMLDGSVLQPNSIVLDVALPHSFSGKRKDVTVYLAERMSMPSNWHRGRWGAIYHVISGYGFNTVLACFVEPLVLTHAGRDKPFAQGRRLKMSDVIEFGEYAERLGFIPVLSK